MASDRQLELARRLAEGEDGVSAMVAAGWPIETASFIGPDAFAYLAKAGITVDRRGVVVKALAAAPETDVSAVAVEAPAGEPDPPTEITTPRPRRRAKETSE